MTSSMTSETASADRKKFERLLSPLSGVCTHALLHQAREAEYGPGYNVFPTFPRADADSPGTADTDRNVSGEARAVEGTPDGGPGYNVFPPLQGAGTGDKERNALGYNTSDIGTSSQGKGMETSGRSASPGDVDLDRDGEVDMARSSVQHEGTGGDIKGRDTAPRAGTRYPGTGTMGGVTGGGTGPGTTEGNPRTRDARAGGPRGREADMTRSAGTQYPGTVGGPRGREADTTWSAGTHYPGTGAGIAGREADMTRSLVYLGQAGHVPHCPLTRGIEAHFRQIAAHVCAHAWSPLSRHRPVLTPIGSYPGYGKVGDMDELDYLCQVRLEETRLQDLGKAEAAIYCFHSRIHDMMVTMVTRDHVTPHVTRVHRHGPASCLEITWYCNHGHRHVMSVDLTVCLELTDTQEVVREYYGHGYSRERVITTRRRNRLPSRGPSITNPGKYIPPAGPSPPGHDGKDGRDVRRVPGPSPPGRDVRRVPEPVLVLVKAEWRLSSALYDPALLRDLCENLSPDIPAVYRALKLLVPALVWRRLRKDSSSIEGYSITETVSSHAIKSLLYREISTSLAESRNTGKGWSLLSVVVCVLRALLSSQPAGFRVMWPVVEDFITERFVGSYLPEEMLPDTAGIQALIHVLEGTAGPEVTTTEDKSLASALLEKFTACFTAGREVVTEEEVTGPSDPAETDQESVFVLTKSGVMCKIRRSMLAKVAIPGDEVRVYIPCTEPPSPNPTYTSHPLLLWCTRYINRLYTSKGGVNMTHIPGGDMEQVWPLMYNGQVSTEDIQSGEYKKNVIEKL